MPLISPRIIEWSFFGVNAYLNADTGKIAYSHEKMTREQLLSIKGFAAPRFIPRVSSKYEVYTLCFRVSSACNLHCSYCFRKKDCPKPAEKVSDVSREIGRFLSKAKHCKRLFVDLSGDAEPLLAIDEILKVAAFCDAKEKESGVDIVVQFVCNGTLLTEDAVSKLQKAGKRVYLFEDNEVGTSILNLDGFGGLCNTNFDPDELFSDEPVGSLGYNLRRIFDYMEKC